MRALLLIAVIALPALAEKAERFEVSGTVEPRGRARIILHGATVPFSAEAIADPSGKFRIRKLAQGTYSIGAFTRTRGEVRLTVEVGPGTADSRGRVRVELHLKPSDAPRENLTRRYSVSATQLATPEKAVNEYREAHKSMAKRDSAGAARHLERAVEIAPHFAVAWNTLGTVYYQTKRFSMAEECFRRSLAEDPAAFEALVNLGGVLVTQNKLDEAMDYNLRAVLARPNDALANSQLGMTYYALGKPELAVKYLERARAADPAHFSHPQLLLAEIHLRSHRAALAADDLEDFLKHHPDWPGAAEVRTTIAKLRR